MFTKYFGTTLAVISALVMDVWGLDHMYCEDLAPQMDINIEQIIGVWFGVEYITHTRDPNMYNQYQHHNNRFEVSDTCFFIDIKEVEQWPTTPAYYQQTTPLYEYGPRAAGVVPEQRYRHLVLQWDEPGNPLEYHVTFNMTRRGFWITTAPQNGARMADMYKHFAGTIQVLKAVSNHLVLSFCQRLPEQQLFTVIFSRQQQQLDDGEIISIHNLLSRKRLSTSSVKKVCNGAMVLGVALPTVLLAVLSYFLSINL